MTLQEAREAQRSRVPVYVETTGDRVAIQTVHDLRPSALVVGADLYRWVPVSDLSVRPTTTEPTVD